MTAAASAAVSLGTLQADLGPELDQVRGEIGRAIAADFPLIADVNSHLLRMQGKMIRPTLLLLENRATGVADSRVVRLGGGPADHSVRRRAHAHRQPGNGRPHRDAW